MTWHFYNFGAALAMIISWSFHQSIVWCIVHGLLSWAYVAWIMATKALA